MLGKLQAVPQAPRVVEAHLLAHPPVCLNGAHVNVLLGLDHLGSCQRGGQGRRGDPGTTGRTVLPGSLGQDSESFLLPLPACLGALQAQPCPTGPGFVHLQHRAAWHPAELPGGPLPGSFPVVVPPSPRLTNHMVPVQKLLQDRRFPDGGLAAHNHLAALPHAASPRAAGGTRLPNAADQGRAGGGCQRCSHPRPRPGGDKKGPRGRGRPGPQPPAVGGGTGDDDTRLCPQPARGEAARERPAGPAGPHLSGGGRGEARPSGPTAPPSG